MPMTDNSEFEQWITRPIPTMPDNELALFTDMESIDAQAGVALDHKGLSALLRSYAGTKVMGIDLGGGSVRGRVFVVSKEGSLQVTDDFSRATEAEEGKGFLEQLEAFAAYAKEHNLVVGMSYGGPVDGTIPRRHPKIPKLMEGLQEKYDNDFARVFSTPFALLNDGPAGLLRGVEEVIMYGGDTDPAVLYLINGGGLGVGVFKDGQLYSTEAGHVACVAELNQNDVSRACGLYGDHVCLENIISNKQGLELQWWEHSGERLSGKEIEDCARRGDDFAMNLFEQAALAEATILAGVAKVFALDVKDPRCHVVVHGGMHRTPNLQKRLAQILWQTSEPEKAIIFTEDFDQNACMHGAALHSLTSLAK